MCYKVKTFCGCQNLSDGSKTIAIIQFLLGVGYAALCIYNESIHGIVGGVILTLLGVTLYVGVRYELLLLIYLWLLSCSLILIFFIFELVVALSALAGLGSTNTRYEPEGYLTSTLVSVLVTAGAATLDAYGLLVVFSLTSEIRNPGGNGGPNNPYP